MPSNHTLLSTTSPARRTTSLNINSAARRQHLTTSISHGRRYAPVALSAPQPSSFQAPSFHDDPPHQYNNAHHHQHQTHSAQPAKTPAHPKPTSMNRPFSSEHFYHSRVLEQYVSKPVNTITLRQLCFFGRNMTNQKLIRLANYARTELAIRLAHRIHDFQNLPFIVGTNPHIAYVYDLYWQAFDCLRCFPQIDTMDDNEAFCKMLQDTLKDHLVVIPQLALGIVQCAQHISPSQVDRFMNTMLRSRISRRVIAEQHLALTHSHELPHSEEKRDCIGMVNTHCSAIEIVGKCAGLARDHCISTYGHGQPDRWEPPQVVVNGHPDVSFTYIPDHLEYIIYELLMNSMTYTVLRFSPPDSSSPLIPLPPVTVTICSGDSDLIFRVSDQAGGIPSSRSNNLWSYSHAPDGFVNFDKVPRLAASMAEHVDGVLLSPTPHLGIGLPMSKVYAEYWGGELNIISMDGFGTDAYVKIPKLGNRMENLGFQEFEATDPSWGSIPKEGPAGAGWVPNTVSVMVTGGSTSAA
ncbi:hypothetical protein BC936DRAFT_143716 [Jimgerdemannia flammicorona]|uniref:Uncharacterized protein n=2 Tax=Jimgerdemannia flammicorona TaxID=994334 RepID=A0A433QUC4_9FUNG|nr:hypothetical protein BC936DRAFT_143716 [Jimgerdemannia flammicorona]RUS33348.1 hypothetical protein BC938DRAFT_472063 [Jimgerdemannia flammicorona]